MAFALAGTPLASSRMTLRDIGRGSSIDSPLALTVFPATLERWSALEDLPDNKSPSSRRSMLVSGYASKRCAMAKSNLASAHADHLSGEPYIKARTGAKIGIGDHIRDVQKIGGAAFGGGLHALPKRRCAMTPVRIPPLPR